MKTIAVLFVVATLAACSDPQPAANTPAPAEARAESPLTPGQPASITTDGKNSPAPTGIANLEADYLGRWTGVEGMYLVVASKPGGGVTLDMQWDLDNKDMLDGTVTAEGLRFMRKGVEESAVRTDGDATGLKYLAGKQACLTVRPGEGYCKD